MKLGKEREVGELGRTGLMELLYQRTGTTVTMDTFSEAKQGKGKQREVFDKKEMEKANLQEKAKSQVFFKKIKYKVNLPLSGFP